MDIDIVEYKLIATMRNICIDVVLVYLAANYSSYIEQNQVISLIAIAIFYHFYPFILGS